MARRPPKGVGLYRRSAGLEELLGAQDLNLGDLQARVLVAFARAGERGLTSSELREATNAPSSDWPRPRRTELAELGLIEYTGSRASLDSGKLSRVYTINEIGQREAKRLPEKYWTETDTWTETACTHCGGTGIIRKAAAYPEGRERRSPGPAATAQSLPARRTPRVLDGPPLRPTTRRPRP
jgi:hypothetical protein